MGSLGWMEILMILGVVVLLFGGTRLAGIGKGLGQGIKEFKSGLKNGDADADAEEEEPSKPKAKAKKTAKAEADTDSDA
jgi:sec-independent protein translocase protein TatA